MESLVYIECTVHVASFIYGSDLSGCMFGNQFSFINRKRFRYPDSGFGDESVRKSVGS